MTTTKARTILVALGMVLASAAGFAQTQSVEETVTVGGQKLLKVTLPVGRTAIADDTVVVVDCPVDYAENMKLTAKLGELTARL